MDEEAKIAMLCVLGSGLAANLTGLVWIIRHVIRARREGTI